MHLTYFTNAIHASQKQIAQIDDHAHGYWFIPVYM